MSEKEDRAPATEPWPSPSDPHTPPLDHADDARWLDPMDPRRRKIERDRGRPFED
jgi:hypothetical protein